MCADDLESEYCSSVFFCTYCDLFTNQSWPRQLNYSPLGGVGQFFLAKPLLK